MLEIFENEGRRCWLQKGETLTYNSSMEGSNTELPHTVEIRTNPFGIEPKPASIKQDPGKDSQGIQAGGESQVKGNPFGLDREASTKQQAEETERFRVVAEKTRAAQERRVKLLKDEIPLEGMTEGEKTAYLLKHSKDKG